MSESNLTKYTLANSIKELMKRTPIAKISVGDIVAHCGLNRQTFYYHFKDKYDLVNWIFYTEAVDRIKRFSTRDHWVEGFCDLCCHMRENKEFYMNALSATGQNSFSEYLQDFSRELFLSMINELRGNAPLSKADREFISVFYSVAFVGVISYWAERGMKENPVDYIDRFLKLLDGTMLQQIIHPFESPPAK
ncbi:dihydroxyacetone kinase transcriptional activator DhaS [Papillibacter cinnamivorans]|uniref:Transcriptional regulator, TetR family n=1 Tax=Papillibacter cinnamivorans DSM 12816 TaxID=1122930 RepID=A0A1W2CQT8_9FIRM|nr:dihydroxyacetone kinase transcriptional activator DhaS [Papillibacter cinnamivorans]SMC87625.1 transcriptional regulator, TetR family [Papillibacter cinnamivorans DSM 12816]